MGQATNVRASIPDYVPMNERNARALATEIVKGGPYTVTFFTNQEDGATFLNLRDSREGDEDRLPPIVVRDRIDYEQSPYYRLASARRRERREARNA